METYSLLVEELDQWIDRDALEAASDMVPSIARADCPRLHRELFGVLASGLSHADAMAFRIALRERGFAVNVVADDEVPVLPESYGMQRVVYHGEVLIFTDAMGRMEVRPLADLVFAAGGKMDKAKVKFTMMVETPLESSLEYQMLNKWEYAVEPRMGEQRSSVATERHFRVDYFFASEPHRLSMHLAQDGAFFFQDQAVRLAKPETCQNVLAETRKLLPDARLNSGITRPELSLVYPSQHAYEKEIRWHFHRLGVGQAT